MAEWVLSTKNEIPFFKASLFAGGLMLILLFIFLRYTTLGIWSLILARVSLKTFIKTGNGL